MSLKEKKAAAMEKLLRLRELLENWVNLPPSTPYEEMQEEQEELREAIADLKSAVKALKLEANGPWGSITININ